MCLSLTNAAFAKDGKYPKHVCKEIYDAIGIFLFAADEAWKQTMKSEQDMLELLQTTYLFVR